MTLTVAPNERGLVRVFALSMDEAEARALSNDATAQAKALGQSDLNIAFVEVFALSDLDELGLAGYLIEGNGIDPASLEADRAKLKALSGWVLIAYSSAFPDAGTKLTPSAELTHIGTYAEPGVDWSATEKLVSKAATGTTAPARKKPSDAAMSGRVATLVLLVLFALVAVMVWVAS
jgi:hypothetical protein